MPEGNNAKFLSAKLPVNTLKPMAFKLHSTAKTLNFKTNINCATCVAKVTPLLNNFDGINSWSVDILSNDKTLSVKHNGVSQEEIISIIKKAGFKIEMA